MAIRLWHTGPGSEKAMMEILSEALRRHCGGADYSGVFYLCPTRHILGKRRLAFHKTASQMGHACYIPPSFLTLPQLGRRLQGLYSKKPALSKTLRPAALAMLGDMGIGHAAFVSEFVTEIKHQFPGASMDDIRKALDEAYAGANAPDEVIRRGMDALGLMGSLDSALEGIGLIDEDDILPVSAGFAGHLKISLLVLDGFYELLPSEERLVHALIKHAPETIAFAPISGPEDDLSYCYSIALKEKFGTSAESIATEPSPGRMAYFPAPSIEAEVEEIARHIKASYLSTKNRELGDTWVVFPVLEPYRNLVGRVFGRFGIPHEFSSGRPCISHPAYQGLMALLESSRDGLPRLAFTRFLTSPHFTRVPETVRERAASVGISNSLLRGKSAWIRAFEPHGLSHEIKTIMNSIRHYLNNDKTDTYAALVNNLLELLKRLGFSPPSGLPAFEEQLKGLCLLDRLMPKPASLEGFIEVLRSVFSTSPLETGSATLGVRVASIFDVRGLEPRMLYLGGLKDGDFPSRPEMDFILPDNIRRRLGLLDMRRFLHLQGRIFRRLSLGAGEVFYSYPTMEGDKYFLPSLFISDGEPIDRPTGGIYCEADLQRLRSSGRDEVSFREITGIPRGSDEKGGRGPLRVTEIDSYRRCPRRHFIEHMLRLEPSEIVEYEVEARDLGIIAHKVMQRLITYPLPALKEFRANASKTLDKTLKETRLDQYQQALLKETFLNIIGAIHETEEKLIKEGFQVHEKEFKVEGSIDGVMLTGKADRIDRGDDGSLEVMDYKTGSADISGAAALRGESLQLFLYAAMLRARGLRPERVGVYSLKDVGIKWVPGSRDKKQGQGLDDFMDAAEGYLKETAKNISRGDFPANPLKEQDCGRCGENPYCPFVHGGTR